MKIKRSILLVAVVFFSLSVRSDTVKICAVVLDDVTMKPVPDAEVCFSFKEDNGWRAWSESPKRQKIFRRTDDNGYCTAIGISNCGRGGCYVENPPEGYYHPALGWKNKYDSKDLFGVWQPDNLVATIKLQRVEHPIPLWVKDVEVMDLQCQAPAFNGTNATWRYDFLAGDWLPPVGKGKVADMTIETHYKFIEKARGGMFDFDCYEYAHSIAFAGKGNGVVSQTTEPTSGIKLRHAPADGYESSFSLHNGMKSYLYGVNITPKRYTDENDDRCYAFRIRSEYDDKGKLVSAYYGKIYGDFQFADVWRHFTDHLFSYYLNTTTLDRNLEWDMKNNLCPVKKQRFAKQP